MLVRGQACLAKSFSWVKGATSNMRHHNEKRGRRAATEGGEAGMSKKREERSGDSVETQKRTCEVHASKKQNRPQISRAKRGNRVPGTSQGGK